MEPSLLLLSDYLLYITLTIFPQRFPSSSHPMLPGIYRWNHPSFPSLIICCILHSPYSPIGSPHHHTLCSLVYTGGTIPPSPLWLSAVYYTHHIPPQVPLIITPYTPWYIQMEPSLLLSDYLLYIKLTIFPQRFPSSSHPMLPGIHRWNHPSPSPLWLSAVYYTHHIPPKVPLIITPYVPWYIQVEPSLLLSDYLLYITLTIFPQRFPSSSHPMFPGIYRWNNPSFSSDYLLYITLTIFPQRFPSSSHPMLPGIYRWNHPSFPSLIICCILNSPYSPIGSPHHHTLCSLVYTGGTIPPSPLIICCILHSPYSPIGPPHHQTLCSLVYTGGTSLLPLSDYLLYITLTIFPLRFPSSSHPMLPGIYRWNHPSFPSLIICCILHSPYSPKGSPHHHTLCSLVYTGGTIPPSPLIICCILQSPYSPIGSPHHHTLCSLVNTDGTIPPSPLWLSAVY